MSRDIPAALQTHIAAKGAAALALCADITRPDDDFTSILRFTSWDRDLVIEFDGGEEPLYGTYLQGLGMSVSRVQGNSAGAVDHLEAKLLLNGSVVTDTDVLAGRWRGATIRLFLVNPEDLTMGEIVFHTGTLGQTTLDLGTVTAEFLGLLQRYLSTIGETVTSTCQNIFCGAVDSRGRGCGLDIADYTFTGTVTDYDDAATIGGQPALIMYSDDLDGFADDLFNDGRITFDDEPWIAIGVRLFRQTEGACVLKQQPPFTISLGMTFTIIQDCAKTATACQGYTNMARFRGFPHLKGTDLMLQVGQR
jgi:uncharacterized phage protein (TIGR02218 family)